eukprot:TRINITY_DN2173_c4_g1_i1.p1 TRINITY_DN2173_c4_g1~~TRINITY_DN2173_c4_g1_i1.p1  ORF type:complete len:295 (-),score=42.44 TRINITY_DN2173_c4_g1_i1:163-933(-)
MIVAVEEYLQKLAKHTTSLEEGCNARMLTHQDEIKRRKSKGKFERFLDVLIQQTQQQQQQKSQQDDKRERKIDKSESEDVENEISEISGQQSVGANSSQQLDNLFQIQGRLVTSLADFQTREDVRNFLRNVINYQVKIKGREYIEEAYSHLTARHGQVAIEQRIVSLLAVKDEDDDFMGANLKNYRMEAAEEYNLKWRMLSTMIDKICQIFIFPVFIIYMVVFIVVVLKLAEYDQSWFESMTESYARENERSGQIG